MLNISFMKKKGEKLFRVENHRLDLLKKESALPSHIRLPLDLEIDFLCISSY